jgi:diguanylate cyclase (GGDEF)-like protein
VVNPGDKLIDLGQGLVLVVDLNGKVVHASEALNRLLGHAPGALIGKPPHFLSSTDRTAALATRGTFSGALRRRDGTRQSITLREQKVVIHGGEARIITIVDVAPSDMSIGPMILDVVSADGDRAALSAPANAMMATALGRGGQVAFFRVRVDRLQQVNQTAGYEVGDAILREALERLRLHAIESAVLARTATNQFALVTPVDGSGREIERLSDDLLAVLSAPYEVDRHAYRLAASVGVAVFPVHGSAVSELLHASDLALREARHRGGNRVELFSPAYRDRLNRELSLDHALSDALRHGEFELNYQPLVDLDTSAILGAEALLRWTHPELGKVSPAEFIPRAEATGLIVPIGEWVLHRAFEEAKSWETKGGLAPRLGVNLSAVQFSQDDLVETVTDALATSKLSPERVDVELTEHSIAADSGARNDTISELRDLGITVSIDDFGTGYSSLSQLVDCPVDTLKIDQSFVAGLVHHPQSVTIVRTIIEMARSLGLKLAAEGTERKDQIEFLKDAGCDYAQGHFFHKAMPASDFRSLLA